MATGYAREFVSLECAGTLTGAITVDWLNATCGEPCVDACRSYVLMSNFDRALAKDYLAAWRRMTGQALEAVTAWLGFVAGARLAENIPHETDALWECRTSGLVYPAD